MNIPKFRLPGLVARIGGRLPAMGPHSLTLIAGLNAAVKMKLLPLDSLTLLEGRTFLVEVLDTGGQANFTYRNGLFPPIVVGTAKHLIFPSVPTCLHSCKCWPVRKTRIPCSSTANCRSRGDTETWSGG